MKLESGDILSFELEQRGMTLQFRDGDCGEDHEDDTVTLDGVGAMRLMWGLRQIGQGMKPEFKTIADGPDGKLEIGYADNMCLLYGADNVVTLDMHEVYAMMCAMSTRIWRMFL